MGFFSGLERVVGSSLNNLLGVTEQNDFNSSQAALSRQWSQNMSSTAYQRAVADMRAAGLNPVLAGLNATSASTPGASTASSASGNGGIGQLASLVGAIGSAYQQFSAADNQRAQAHLNNALAKFESAKGELAQRGMDVLHGVENNTPGMMDRMTNWLVQRYIGHLNASNPGVTSSRAVQDAAQKQAEKVSVQNAEAKPVKSTPQRWQKGSRK